MFSVVSRRRERGQATTEFAISAIVLLLLLAGLLDLSRVFYFRIDIYGAAREGARHGSWFDTPNRRNPYLDDSDILSAVSLNLKGAGLPAVTTNSSAAAGSCPTPSDGNTFYNPPFGSSYYPTTNNAPLVYLCYSPPNPANAGCTIGTSLRGSLTTAPTDNCWRLGDVNVIVLMSYGLITPLLQGFLGNGLPVAANAHVEIQGKP